MILAAVCGMLSPEEMKTLLDSVHVAIGMAQKTAPVLGDEATLEIIMHETKKANYPMEHLAYFFGAAVLYGARLQNELDRLRPTASNSNEAATQPATIQPE